MVYIDFSKQIIWESSGTNLYPLLQHLLRLASLDFGNEVLGVEPGADGVLSKRFAPHELVGCPDRVEIVHLRLQHVSVGILVVH